MANFGCFLCKHLYLFNIYLHSGLNICIKSLFAQWAKYPAELDAAVLARLPYRENTDDR